jgi:catechol 2,3-dioxygenase-like lactoylglutathione lyase family enzyme
MLPRMQPHISLVALAVADVGRAARFYREGLGWPMSSASSIPEVAFFQCGPLVLALYEQTNFAADLRLDFAAGGPPRHTLAHNVPARALVDTIMDQARAAGATIIGEAAETPWGGYAGYFADPDGHPWEIAWNPGFALSETGAVTLPA